MNAQAKPDPFAQLLAKRTQTATIKLPDGTDLEVEIREAPIKEVRFLLSAAQTMDPQELSFRMLGAAVYIGGQQLTYDRIEEMAPDMIKALVTIMPQVFGVFGLEYQTDDDAPTDAPTDQPPEKKESTGSTPERAVSSSLPSSSAEPSAS